MHVCRKKRHPNASCMHCNGTGVSNIGISEEGLSVSQVDLLALEVRLFAPSAFLATGPKRSRESSRIPSMVSSRCSH